MSKSYELEPPEVLTRLPGEPLAKFYNRKLRAKGRFDIEWYQTPSGALRLRHVVKNQTELEL